MTLALKLLSIMAAFVCDLNFDLPATDITAATGPSNPDGAVSVAVTTNSGLTPKFALNSDPSYASRTNTTGVFTGLLPGTYTVNCRLSDNCVRELTVTIIDTNVWVPRYRLQFGTITDSGLSHRFDIEQLNYIGGLSYPEAGAEPVVVEWRNEGGVDPFVPLLGSSCSVTLNSRTDGEFDDLNTYNEKKYRGSYYINGSLRWQGFLTPMNNEEPYNQETNYDVVLFFTDGLQDLESKPFSDDSGNEPVLRMSALDAIVFCLNKTNLMLPIEESVGVYPVEATTTLSILDQIFFDPAFFLEDGEMRSCKDVIREIMLSLGASLLQADGAWHITNPTLKTASSVLVKHLTYKGAYQSYEDIDYRILLRKNSALGNKITFAEGSGRKANIPMYGAIKFVHDLGIKELNTILVSGDFEDEDIINGQLKNWQVDASSCTELNNYYNPLNIPGVERFYSIETVEESRAFVAKTYLPAVAFNRVDEKFTISSLPVPIVSTGNDNILKITFDTLVIPSTAIAGVPWVYFDYAVSIEGTDTFFLANVNDAQGNLTFIIDDPGNPLIDGKYQRVYVDDFNTFKKIEINTSIGPLNVGDLQIEFRPSTNPAYEYASFSELNNVDAVDLLRKGLIKTSMFDELGGVYDSLFFYELLPIEDSTKPQSIPDYIIAGPTVDPAIEAYVWVLRQQCVYFPSGDPFPKQATLMNSFALDNVSIKYIPNGEEPEQEVISETVIDNNVKRTLEVTLPLADLPYDENLRNISTAWLSLSNGTPTSMWKLVGNPSLPARSLIDLMTSLYRSQYQLPRRKLMGEFDLFHAMPFPSNTIYEVRSGKIYVIASDTFMARQALAGLELLEALQGTAIPENVPDPTPNPDPDVEPPQSTADFSSADFDSSDFYTI